MSLTNPNSVVTEERLSEFYQGILPYLGGMPDILANKFDRSNLYSTDEKIVGRWIDGKPIYQKTITNQSITLSWVSSNKHALATIDPLIANVDLFISIKGYIPATNVVMNISAYVDNNKWKLASILGDTITTLTIQYTKTTDSPVEIGLDTDYSTTEKIIGTWIDGRPLYQKTVVGEITSSSTARAWFDIYDATDLNIDDIFFQSESYYVAGGYSMPVFGTLFSQADNYINVAYLISSHKIQFIKYGFGAGKYKVTFNYTKTTDQVS